MYLKRLEIQGFKTFATRTVLEFRPGVTAIVGPNGSGKCLAGHSLVLLADGREIPIRDIVERALAMSTTVEMLDDGWVSRQNPEQLRVLSLSPATFRLEPRSIAGFVKRQAPDKMLYIRTRTGREVTVTPYHPLFTLRRGRLHALHADELEVGVRIALSGAGALIVPRSLSTTTNPNLDIIPGVTPQIRSVLKQAGISVQRHRAGCPKMAAYAEGRCEASRAGLLEVLDVIEAACAQPSTVTRQLARLRALATSDVFWDEIVAIESLPPPEPWVYDLSIAETHNFVAEQVIVHNSNLADAVRWVLGEQSLATLRCKRSEELIYAGGGRRPPAGLAEVSLTIDNSDRLLPLDFDEVTITRRATRAGDNEYFINRARVRLRDVLEATEPLGGSYTLINQGLVDAALTLRPEERRRLFEDAAEIGGFEARKAEALRRLRETESNLNRLDDLLAELEPRLRSLKRQAAQARQHRELSAELHQLYQQFYARQWRAACALSARARAELDRLDAELARARAAQAGVAAELQVLRGALRARRDDLGALHQQSSDLHRQAEALQRDLAVGAERVAALTRRGEDLERQRNALALRRQQLEEQQALAAAEAARARTDLHTRRQALAAAEAELAARAAADRAHLAALRQAQDAALQAARAMTEQRARVEQLAASLERLARESADLDAVVTGAAGQRAAAAERVEQARVALEETEAAYQSAAAALQAARAELDDLRAGRTRAEEARAAAWRALTDAEARLESLERLSRAYTGVFAGPRAAMQWAERTGRSGFALVQSLIRPPAGLETAIEAALGARLQNIVVERWEDAEAAIAELKRSGAGRATFLPLDSLVTREHAPLPPRSSDNSDVLGVAADLVEYDQRYTSVVRQLLGRVLIVRDLPAARAELRRIGSGWTIVTLDGEQVSSGGAVTGGAQAKESGTLRRERELRELPALVAAARADLERAGARMAELDARLQAHTTRLRDLEALARERQRQVEAARAGLEHARHDLARAGQEQEWAARRRAALADERAALAKEHQEAAARLQAAEAAARAAEAALAEARARQEQAAGEDRAAQERLAALRAEANAAEGRLGAAEQLCAAHAQSLELLARQEQDFAEAGAALQAERAELGVAHARREAEHAALLTAIDALRARIDPAEAELREEETRLADLEQREAAATAALLERESAHSRAALEAQRAQDRQEALIERAAADGVELDPAPALAGDAAEPEQDASVPIEALQRDIEALKARILRLGPVNPLALEEYDETAERQRHLRAQIEDLREARATLMELIGELDRVMHNRFIATFHAVAAEFERCFVELFGGGSATLVLTGGEGGEPVAEGEDRVAEARPPGVEIIVRPPGKKQQNISLLSGGERALTAAALLFAILSVNPSPFCILDETDAALDETNIGRFRDALRRLSARTQFILITHNRGTIEVADTLYGVSMGDDGSSKTISLRVESYVSGA
ncbi:MAG: chromosome segregation protein SMC [Oscillochloridaceae bacterium]|nr:chromosome segregation protein SMC [Chloroflexaceae bacterium]MDW8392051.1 chromosome segregation protein SMC [Oscillochloridaceae bacterium]